VELGNLFSGKGLDGEGLTGFWGKGGKRILISEVDLLPIDVILGHTLDL